MRALVANRSGSPPSGRHLALLLFCLATVLLIPLQLKIPGLLAWLAAAVITWRTGERSFRLRMGVLLGVILLLGFTPINTDTGNAHLVAIGIPFLAVVLVPALLLKRLDPTVVRFRLWPNKFRWQDLLYVGISVPLAWGIIQLYFFHVNPELPTHWTLPAEPEQDAIWRLFIGINCVGIWDELFFVNTVFVLLRSLFPYRIANGAQAVVYTSVLYKMAFTGIGPVVVYLFALTQGAMFEKSDNLLFVLIVHLIVDAFLVAAILGFYYPDYTPGWF